MIKLFVVFTLLFVPCLTVLGQTNDTSGKVKLYFGCETCDFDFVRKEIPYVDFVRDQVEADVHCYVIKELAANGGSRYTFSFLGQKQFKGLNDTLRFLQQESNTPSEFRTETVHTLMLGLTRYVSHSSQASRIAFNTSSADTSALTVIDPWDSWVFSADVNGYVNLEQGFRFYNYWSNLSANRTTPQWKIRLNLFGSYTENNFIDLGIKSFARSGSFDALAVGSLSDHWSTGPSVSIGTSTFRNRKLNINTAMGLEYNIFPYNQSTTRQLRILYKIGVDKYKYYDTTIYDKTEELIGTHILSASLIFTQPWGSTELTLAGSQYLNDLSLTELNVYANLQFRLFEGFSIRLTGNYAIIHDQIFLPKVGLSSEEVLLQLHQLKTSYSYFTSVGFTYTFGSIYNNVVNPRFGN